MREAAIVSTTRTPIVDAFNDVLNNIKSLTLLVTKGYLINY